jgi:hypothetical protein
VLFEVDPNVRNRESKVDITIQSRHLLSSEVHDGTIIGRSKITTLFDIQSYKIRGGLADDNIEQPLDLRGARCEQYTIISIEERA